MSYTLEPWDVLVSTTLHPDTLLQQPFEPALLIDYTGQLTEKKESIRLVLIRELEKSASATKTEFLVRFNQGILIRLLDRLYHYKHRADLPTALLAFYEDVSGHISYLLDFIEEYFVRYLDQDEKIPLRYISTVTAVISPQLAAVKKMYAGEKVLAILLHHFHLPAWQEHSITYGELFYSRSLLQELLSTAYPDSYTLADRMLVMNFNSFEFLHHLIAAMQQLTEDVDSTVRKSEVLLAYQKKIRLLTERSGTGLYPHYVSVRQGLLHAIENELAFIGTGADPVVAPVSDRSVHVPFKGTEIYLLHKSFIDSGGASGETYRSILEKTASSLSNKTRKGFSVDSLQKNSDKVDYESKENVKRFLMKMIRNVESY